jgi:hydrogenase 3 maturation protease
LKDEKFPEKTTLSTDSWEDQLRTLMKSSSSNKRIALVGMGHPLRSDDYAGSYIVKTLIEEAKGALLGNIRLVDAEDNVEALITRIGDLQPQHVVFVDASEMRMNPGETHLISVKQTAYPFFTTHGIPLKLIAERLLPESEVWILAIQPKSTDFGESLSPEIRGAADTISRHIMKLADEESL